MIIQKLKCNGLNILTLFLRPIRVKIVENFCRFVFCDNIDSFWRLLSLRFIGKSPARTPLLHHLRQHQSFLSSVLLSTTKLSTNQLARNHSVIAKNRPLSMTRSRESYVRNWLLSLILIIIQKNFLTCDRPYIKLI